MDVMKDITSYGQCRCCLEKGQHRDIVKEYNFNGLREVYLDIFKECFNLFLSSDAQLSTLICSKCVQRLRDASSFRMMVSSTERQLLNIINGGNNKDTVNVHVEDSSLENKIDVKLVSQSDVKQELSETDVDMVDFKPGFAVTDCPTLESLTQNPSRIAQLSISAIEVTSISAESAKGYSEENFLTVAALKQAAACYMDGGGHAAFHDHDYHVRQWVSELPPPGTLEGIPLSCRTPVSVTDLHVTIQTADPSQAGPSDVHVQTTQSTTEPTEILSSASGSTSTSEISAAGTTAVGSEYDSDFDEEFDRDEIATSSGMFRNIPDDEELGEPVSTIVNSIERVMDDAIDQLLGVASDFNWCEDFATFKGATKKFLGPVPGPVKDYNAPYDAFTDIWSQDIVEHIVKETNRYAKQVIDKKTKARALQPTSRLRRWTDTNKDEIYVLFAIYMLMGLDPRASQQDFWKSTGYLEIPKFRQLMTYNRFILLNKFIHFVDNTDVSLDLAQNGGDVRSSKLRKIAPILAHLNTKFRFLYNLHSHIVIDESLTLSKGRFSLVQAIKSKATRFGIKSFELCESRTGYLSKFQIYTGKNSIFDRFVAPSVALAGKSTQMIVDLLKGLEYRGHCVTMDNFYNCPALARHLKNLGFDCFGPLRPSRKNVPVDIKNIPENVPKGTIIARHSGDVSCIAWKDTKMVHMISTYHNSETFVGRKTGKVLVKPVTVRDYNYIMEGIDLRDQKLSMYLLEKKRRMKWYMKIFKRLLNVSVHNALILLLGSLKRRNIPLITHRDFREQLVDSLVAAHYHLPREISAAVEIMRLRKDTVHVPKYHSRPAQGHCHICARRGIEKKVYSACVTCEEYMCFDRCWVEWHSLQELPGRYIRVRKRGRRK